MRTSKRLNEKYAAEKSSGKKLQQDSHLAQCDRDDPDQDCTSYNQRLIEGVIQGVTGVFDFTCQDGMMTTVNAAFMSAHYSSIWVPEHTIKFQMALQNMSEATNVVFAFCAFSGLYNEIGELIDFNDTDQYIALGGRISGAMLGEIPRY